MNSLHQSRLDEGVPVTVIFTSRVVVFLVSLAVARSTYSPGAVNVAFTTAFPSFTAMAAGSNSTAAGPRKTSHETESPWMRGRGGGAIDGTLVGAPGDPGGSRKVGGFSEVPPVRCLPGLGSPWSVTSAVSVSVDGRLTDVALVETASVGASLGVFMFSRVSPGTSSISHSGCSHPTARSVFPCVVSVHTTSAFLPKSRGTVTLNTRWLNRR